MSFENFEAPDIAPDKEQALVWANVKAHFETLLQSEEERPFGSDEDTAIRIHEILDAIDENDWSKAYEYLEREIDQLGKEYELMVENKTAVALQTPECIQEEIAELENLKNSLLLEEKE